MTKFVWGGAAFLALTGQVAASCPPPHPTLLFSSCTRETKADLMLLEGGEGVPAASKEGRELVVTGAYTSGEKVEPEGFVLDHGNPYDPYIQGWDGLLLIDEKGDLSLAHVERVLLGKKVFNLRKRKERRAFVKQAGKLKYSAIQSHLLITDGKLDVRDQPSAPRFRRRVLFSDKAGHYGLYDSAEALTLFEAAQEVRKLFKPHMALNLDMGSYDYCVQSFDGRSASCGTLTRAETNKLSNVLVFRQE